MYQARLTRIDPADMQHLPLAGGDDPPVVRWPKPTVRQIEIEGRTVLQMGIAPELLAQLEASENVEVQIVPLDALE
jgi:hypothetical protein